MKIRFEPAGISCAAPVGERVIDITDEHPDADVPYSCRSASCGTCRVRVVNGAEALAPPDEDEREVLTMFGDGPDVRLCCQLVLANDVEEEVVLALVDD